jgi:hypothetical protein
MCFEIAVTPCAFGWKLEVVLIGKKTTPVSRDLRFDSAGFGNSSLRGRFTVSTNISDRLAFNCCHQRDGAM